MATKIPRWANKVLSQPAFEKVENAIAAAEKKTSGEIVPMLVRRSSTVGHVPIMVFLLAWLACEIFDLAGVIAPGIGHWAWELIYAVFSFLVAAGLGRLSTVQRWLVNADDRTEQVNMRAEVEFYEANLTETRGRTGVLIFISLMEHRVTVLADQTIASKLPPATWSEVVEKVVAGIKSNDLASGLEEGIALCGDLLSTPFPRPEGDKNELHDHLIIKE